MEKDKCTCTTDLDAAMCTKNCDFKPQELKNNALERFVKKGKSRRGKIIICTSPAGDSNDFKAPWQDPSMGSIHSSS